MAKGEDYEVGYGKPPKSGQFKPGKSGNPKGRPKAPPTFADLIAREANKTITVTVAGAKVKLTQAEVVAKAIMQKAMKADPVAAKLVILGLESFPHQPEGEALLTDHELALLKEVLGELQPTTPP